MADNRPGVQIAIAIIGVIGVVLAAAISNWDKLFSGASQATHTDRPYSQTSLGRNSPNISNVGGDVNINIKDDNPKTNAAYLSTLIGKEPFSEDLPAPFMFSGFSHIHINDPGSAQRLSAVQIELSVIPKIAHAMDPESDLSDLQTFAHIEVYKSKQSALERSNASRASFVERYPNGVGIEPPTNETFCINGDSDFWTCGGSRGYVYAEITLTPGSNANLGMATSTLSAMLRYADKMTALATSPAE